MSDYCFKNIPDDLYKKVKELARKESRSINKQMLSMIQFAINDKEKREKNHEVDRVG